MTGFRSAAIVSFLVVLGCVGSKRHVRSPLEITHHSTLRRVPRDALSEVAVKAYYRFMNAVAQLGGSNVMLDLEVADSRTITLLAINGVLSVPSREVARYLDVYTQDESAIHIAPRRRRESTLLPLAENAAMERVIIGSMADAYMQSRQAHEQPSAPDKVSIPSASDSFLLLEGGSRAASLPTERWQLLVVRLAGQLRAIGESTVRLRLDDELRTNVSRNAVRRRHAGFAMLHITLTANDDVEQVTHTYTRMFSLYAPPSDSDVDKMTEHFVSEFQKLRTASAAQPYAGPILLEGDAASMFLHQVLGHRAIDQHDIVNLQSGRPLLPENVDVADDPSISSVNGDSVLGGYAVDDIGVAGTSALIVRRGVVANPGLGAGRQRRQRGFAPTIRQTNMVVTSAPTIDQARMRRAFRDEITRSGKPYGIVISTLGPDPMYIGKLFKIPIRFMKRVYRDGREEVVRSGFLESTSLAALTDIVLVGGNRTTLNLYCSGSSGFVPTSVSSPALLLKRGEIARGQGQPLAARW